MTQASTLTVKCRYPQGNLTLQQLSPKLSLKAFQELLSEKTAIPPSGQILKSGFPPMEWQLPQDGSKIEIGNYLRDGELLIVEEKTTEDEASASYIPVQSGYFPVLPSSSQGSSSELTTAMSDGYPWPLLTSYSQPDEELDRAIALSLAEEPPRRESSFEPAPAVSHRMEDGTYIVRRFVDSDNSCLFTSVAYVMEGNRLRGFDLRSVIANTVQSDPYHYNEAFLGRPNREYCEWIVNPKHWGGEIELLILSHYYRRQIAAYDIQTTNCYVYGENDGYTERVMLVYDGLHYDALTRSPYQGAPEELDQTTSNPLTPDGQRVSDGAMRLVQKFNEQHQFTNTATFQLRCDECGDAFVGEKALIEHQRRTGHFRFSEYR